MSKKMLLSAARLEKSFGGQTLFNIESISIYDGDRIGLIGQNGCGKTTLLRILAGEFDGDNGNITRYCEVSFVRQIISGTEEEAAKNADPGLLRVMNVADTAGKSGGEQMRLALAGAFSKNNPLIFADEPSTNLDIEGLSLLEEKLKRYPGAVLLISHDRSLLDSVCNQVWAIEDGGLRVFPGSYSEWLEQREREREFAQFEYERYQAEKKRITAEIRNVREEARGLRKPPRHMGSSEWMLYKDIAARQQKNVQRRARSMEKRIEHMEEKAAPQKLPQIQMKLGAAYPVISKTAVRVQGFCKKYGSHTILHNAGFSLPTGSKTVMLGSNGAGKTTLANELINHGDSVIISPDVRLGYFSQGHEILDSSKTVLENVRSESSLSEADVRSVLANLLFPGEMVFKTADVLSGGERAKAALAKLLACDCNLLLLDEPTNHIDIYAAEALESMLSKWNGTLLIITHDRKLAEKVADRLLFVENKSVRTFEGGWREWVKSQRPRQSQEDINRLLEDIRRIQKPGKPEFIPNM